jgi:hypothetical protein
MKYRGENLVENSVNERCRGWDLEDIAGDSTPCVPIDRRGQTYMPDVVERVVVDGSTLTGSMRGSVGGLPPPAWPLIEMAVVSLRA